MGQPPCSCQSWHNKINPLVNPANFWIQISHRWLAPQVFFTWTAAAFSIQTGVTKSLCGCARTGTEMWCGQGKWGIMRENERPVLTHLTQGSLTPPQHIRSVRTPKFDFASIFECFIFSLQFRVFRAGFCPQFAVQGSWQGFVLSFKFQAQFPRGPSRHRAVPEPSGMHGCHLLPTGLPTPVLSRNPPSTAQPPLCLLTGQLLD